MRKTQPSELPDGWEQERPTWPHHEASRFVEAAGIRWHVQHMGQGPPLVLIHGTGASTHSWRDLMPLLARRYSVTAVDLPGHAFTDDLSPARTSITGMSEALGALLRGINVSPVYCVGHSAGAVILCKMALEQSIRPRQIISVNGAFLPLGGAASYMFAPFARLLANSPAMARLVAPRPHQAHAAVRRLIAQTGSTLDDSGVDLYVRLVRKPRHIAGALRMMGNWRLHEFKRLLPQCTVPLTLIAAGNDLLVPPRQADIVQRIAGHASVRRVEGLGHLAHEESPQFFAEQITAICDS